MRRILNPQMNPAQSNNWNMSMNSNQRMLFPQNNFGNEVNINNAALSNVPPWQYGNNSAPINYNHYNSNNNSFHQSMDQANQPNYFYPPIQDPNQALYSDRQMSNSHSSFNLNQFAPNQGYQQFLGNQLPPPETYNQNQPSHYYSNGSNNHVMNRPNQIVTDQHNMNRGIFSTHGDCTNNDRQNESGHMNRKSPFNSTPKTFNQTQSVSSKIPNNTQQRNNPAYQTNKVSKEGASNTIQPKMMRLTQIVTTKSETTNSRNLSKSKGNDAQAKLLANKFSSETPNLSDQGLHILTVPLAKLVQIAKALPQKAVVNFELTGSLAIDSVIHFSHVPGFRFNLVDAQIVQSCVFYDMDGVNPYLEEGKVYRCVGRYHLKRGLFQCYSISECNVEDLKIIKVFEMRSESQLTRMRQEVSNKER